MTPDPARRGRELLEVLYADCVGQLELRAITPGDGESPVRRFLAPTDAEGVIKFIKENGGREIYFGVALRKDGSSGTLKNCTALTVIFADLDFKSFPDGEAGARAALQRCPLAPTAVIRSGNGLHVYFRLVEPFDLPSEAAAARSLLCRLALYLGGDLASAEPAHVLRLPGTRNHKYTPARLVEIETLDVTRVYQPGDFDEWLPTEQEASPAGGAPPINDTIPKGQRNTTLASLAGTMRRRGMTVEAIEAALLAENAAKCRPPLPEDEVRAIAHSVGRYEPEDGTTHGTPPDEEAAHRTVTLTPASGISVRPVRWLWRDRLPLGSLGLLAGREGVGKSICGYTIGADLTQGRLPGAYFGTPRSVIVAATEDSWAHTIVPRLMAADANLDRVYRVEVTTSEGADSTLCLPRDLKELEQRVREVEAALIILDPLLSRLDAKLDTHVDAEVRRALEPMVKLAEVTGACVLGVIHVNKSTTSDPLTMVMGSRAFAAVARSVLFVMADPDNEEKRLLGQIKNNLGRGDLPTREFRIFGAKVADTSEGPVLTGKLRWLGETDRSIRDVIAASSKASGNKSTTQEAADWLVDYLKGKGGAAESSALKDAGEQVGHSRGAIDRARRQLGLGVRKQGFPGKTYWSLPAQSPHRAGETTTTGTTGTTGVSGSQSSQSSQSSQPPEGDAPLEDTDGVF